MRIAMVDIITSLQASGKELIPVSEICYLFHGVCDILDKAVPMLAGNAAHI